MNADFDGLMACFEDREKKEKQDLLDKIKKVQDRLANKDKAIEELQYERNLIFGNLCSIISNDLRNSAFNIFRGFTSDMFWKAWRWSCHKDTVDKELEKGDLTQEEYKSHKTAFDMTVSIVKSKFFGDLKDKVKFKGIIMSWTVGYDYIYTYKKQEISIFIPVFHADDKDYYCALSGYRANYKESEYCSGYICNDLDYKKVAEKLQDWLINEKWKEKK
jgi:hypothetical protein